MSVKKSLLIIFGIVALFSQISLSQADSSTAPKSAEQKAINKDSGQKFKPSYLSIKGHRKLTEKDWTDPEICAQCHPRQYEGWKGSMHSNSFNDPVFQAEWALAEKATDGALTNYCGACHTPIGVATQSITFNPEPVEGAIHGKFTAPPLASKGVSCDVCHTISGSNISKTAVLEHGNASFVMDPGPVKRATLKDPDPVSPFHATEYSEHHTSSAFCGNCHNIFHPGNNFPIERTYDEWKYSSYAQKNVQCMDCHMVPVATAIRVADEMKPAHELENSQIGGFAGVGGPLRKVVHDHGFVGGNAVITSVLNGGGKESKHTKEAVRRLQSAASINVSVISQNAPLHKLVVRVNNDRAGHNLPTSLTNVRQIWLEVTVTDDQGNELMRSGTLTKGNELPSGTVIFNANAVDKNGKYTQFPWEVASFSDTNTIPPKGHRDSNYAFNLAADSKEIKVIAKLHYRSFSQYTADKLLGKGKVLVPSVEMVVHEVSFPVVDKKVLDNISSAAPSNPANH